MPMKSGILLAFLLVAPVIHASAQDLVPCPVAPAELSRRCARTVDEIRTLESRIVATDRRLQDPAILLARVERLTGESVEAYRLRVAAQEGVPAPKSNAWLPLQGVFFNPDSQTCFVALRRHDYWRYVWESLGQDLDLARRTFTAREYLSLQEKQQQRINPIWGLRRWEADLAQLHQFQLQCCAEPPEGSVEAPGAVPR